MLLPMHVLNMSVYISGRDILLADRALCSLSPRPEEDVHPGLPMHALMHVILLECYPCPTLHTLACPYL